MTENKIAKIGVTGCLAIVTTWVILGLLTLAGVTDLSAFTAAKVIFRLLLFAGSWSIIWYLYRDK
jgi:hypothetical protein